MVEIHFDNGEVLIAKGNYEALVKYINIYGNGTKFAYTISNPQPILINISKINYIKKLEEENINE